MTQFPVEPIALDKAVKEVVPRLRLTLEQAEAREAELKELVETQKTEVQRIRRALTIFDPNYVHPNTSKPKKVNSPKNSGRRVGVTTRSGTATGMGISIEACQPIVDEILKRTDGKPDKFVVQRELVHDLGLDQSKVSAAFRYLRSIEFLRRTGRVDGRKQQWAVMDKDAYARVMSGLTQGGN